MLATPWPEWFADDGWSHEIKWDGVRALVYAGAGPVRVMSRRGIDAAPRYPELGGFAPDRPVVLDGEIVALDDAGRPSFERLQQRMNLASDRLITEARRTVPISYVVFDILHDGAPVVAAPLRERRERLAALELSAPMARSHPVDGDPADLWDFVEGRGIEGIVSKRLDSPYRPGVRSLDWRKVSVFRNVRAVVGGFTKGDGARTASFGALLLGLFTADGLRWVGAVGSGFADQDLRAIREALEQMRLERSPFLPNAELPRTAVWVEPRLVAMVRYKEWTASGRLRAPTFKGFTDDPLDDVTWDREGPAAGQ